jgi:hypothetical protein
MLLTCPHIAYHLKSVIPMSVAALTINEQGFSIVIVVGIGNPG